eukprot:scaffold2102_cov161-Amphora_coffeaeformis.AAC.16
MALVCYCTCSPGVCELMPCFITIVFSPFSTNSQVSRLTLAPYFHRIHILRAGCRAFSTKSPLFMHSVLFDHREAMDQMAYIFWTLRRTVSLGSGSQRSEYPCRKHSEGLTISNN